MEKDFSYGLKVKFDCGTVDVRDTCSRHELKSVAGSMFHDEHVVSTCVYNPDGEVELYLKKTPNGVVREERP